MKGILMIAVFVLVVAVGSVLGSEDFKGIACEDQACCERLQRPNTRTGSGYMEFSADCKTNNGGLHCVEQTGCNLCWDPNAHWYEWPINVGDRPICGRFQDETEVTESADGTEGQDDATSETSASETSNNDNNGAATSENDDDSTDNDDSNNNNNNDDNNAAASSASSTTAASTVASSTTATSTSASDNGDTATSNDNNNPAPNEDDEDEEGTLLGTQEDIWTGTSSAASMPIALMLAVMIAVMMA